MLADYQRLMLPRPPQDFHAITDHIATGVAESDMAHAFSRVQLDLAAELLGLIHAQTSIFFEDLVIDVLLAMGYGGRRRDLSRRLGRSGDGGVDGLISMDELGLDLIYLQAKRLRPGSVVPVSDVRDFAGSLDAHRASKGIFVATSHFSVASMSFCQKISRRMVLVDGTKFAQLMIRHNVGVSVYRSYQIKRIDLDYFRTERPGAGLR